MLVIDALWTSLIRQQSESNVGKYRLSVLDMYQLITYNYFRYLPYLPILQLSTSSHRKDAYDYALQPITSGYDQWGRWRRSHFPVALLTYLPLLTETVKYLSLFSSKSEYFTGMKEFPVKPLLE